MSVASTDLVTSGICKGYGTRAILRGVDLTVRKQRVTVVVGTNGAGKSTLLRIVALLEKADRGSVSYGLLEQPATVDWDGPAPAEREALPLRRSMMLAFQHPAMFASSVLGNVTYGLMLRKIPQDEALRRGLEALKGVGIDDRAHQHASSLSGGEAARLAIARALAIQPRLLLLDEPSASLDPYGTRLLEGLLDHMKQELGMTIIMVTQDIFEARRVADDVAFLHEGRIIEQAPRDQFFGDPRDERTRRFVTGELL
jgi:tungstate transport system ATP-binding protein